MQPKPIKLNLGCGFVKEAGYVNVDSAPECNPDVVWDLERTPWPFEDNSVSEIKMKHVLEHLGQTTEVYLNIWKEMWRVSVPGGIIHITVPHWNHDNFHHDPTHVRAITPTGVAMFSQQRNLNDIEAGGSETKLGLLTGIDIELGENDVEFFYTSEVVDALKRGEFTREGLEHLLYHQNNIANEIRMRAHVVKPMRGAAYLAAEKVGSSTDTNDQDNAYAELRLLPKETPGLAAKIGWHDIRLGNFKEGYPKLHQERDAWRAEFVFNLPSEKKYQNGVPLAGKRIFIAPEGGLGDQIMCARFVELYKKQGAYVLLGAPRALQSIFSHLPFPPDEIRIPETVGAHEYDYWIPSFSAVMALGLESPTQGMTSSYLKAHSPYIEKWERIIGQRTNDQPRIGIRWQGNQPGDGRLRVEAVPFETLLQLEELGTLYSLQRDSGMESLASHSEIIDIGSKFETWEDTLAAMDQMDYIVTCCTSIAHAAGALGKRTFVIALTDPYFPWVKQGERSEWYESVTVCKQPFKGDWVGAVAEAAKQIEHTERNRTSAIRIENDLAALTFREAVEAGERGEHDIAEAKYRELLASLTHDHELYHMVRYNLSWYEYRAGNVETGARYRIESGRVLGFIIHPMRTYAKPFLTPETDIRGKTILISSEDGAGDEILASRYALLLKARGAARVLFASTNGLESLLSRVPGIDEAFSAEESFTRSFDYVAFMLELPLILKPTLVEIMHPPLFGPDPAYKEKWKTIIPQSTNLKVGIRWKGEPSRDASQQRNIPFSELENLLDVPGIEIYSLQRDSGVEDIPPSSKVIDLSTMLNTWEDTLAAISALDLVITSDTSIAHLAAALGKETWVLTRSFSYYAWIAETNGKTPWYGSTRIFSEREHGNWEVPLREMKEHLLKRIPQNISAPSL